jgi:mannosyl-oligosaccharide alpha-1,2-mannosidase
MRVTTFSTIIYTLIGAYAIPLEGSSGVRHTARSAEETYIVNQQRADAVREAFRHAWKGYKQYAFSHDELHPLSNGYGDSR